ncbi:TPA: hypothetical protein N0F65_007470 [Lagenidium giganteum]|uniref:DUF659 domain-containing protein n=1 Tax=Lagenidium giganteum TaxID=4803 RepID=A0AAV2ZCW3_9STRA|nr:TPA: hypothetical protein N0F65_007470 [Lagenidium giganteum]
MLPMGNVGHDVAPAPVDTTVTLKKKKPGRSPSQIWMLLTDEPNPQRKNAAACKHCKQQVLYYKKSEQAIRHLKKCSVFQNNQHQYAFISQFQDILPLYNQKISAKGPSKKRQKTAAAAAAAAAAMDHNAAAAAAAAQAHANAMTQLAMNQAMPDGLMDAAAMGLKEDPTKDKTPLKDRKSKGAGGALSKMQQDRMEEAIAMHAYVTGMAFEAIEECHLQRAMSILRPNVKLPDKKRLESELLHRCYDKMHKRVWGYLTASSTRVCIKRDAWSNINLYNTSNPEEVYVTYMAVNNEKRFFLESEKSNDEGQYNSILIAQDIKRVMAPIVGNVSGVVTGSTEYHSRAWEMLKAEYPTKFFYGCITHALHLAIMDIFGPEKGVEHDPRRLTPQWPMDFPFQDLVEFTNNCNEVISFFSSYQYAPKFKMFDAQTLQTMKSFSTTSPTMQWGTLGARFRVLLQSEDIIQSIVSDPEFIAGAPANQRPTRQNIKDFVLNLNWKITLEKAISILTPIELTLYKFQDDKAPISEVYFESKHLLTDFDTVFGLTNVELEYVKKVVTVRWQYVLGEAHGLAFLLDPRYIGKSMTREYREQIEELIFNFPESDDDVTISEERKRALSAEYTDYVIYAKNQRANRTFKWEMLDKGNRSPLQFWMTDADEWPHLKSLSLALFSLSPSSVASEKSLCKSTLMQSSRRNKLGFDDMRRLAFISINDSQFTGNRIGDFQNTLPDFNMGDTGLSPEGELLPSNALSRLSELSRSSSRDALGLADIFTRDEELRSFV